MFEQKFGNLALDAAKHLFTHYKCTILISTPTMSLEEMRRNSEHFNDKTYPTPFARSSRKMSSGIKKRLRPNNICRIYLAN